MTEKRFKCVSDYDWWGVIDTTGEIKGEYNNDCFSTDTVVDLLNSLSEENENITLLAQHNYEESKRIINRYVDKIKELERENNELKEELRIYRQVANCHNCIYHDYDWYDDGDEFEVCRKGNDVSEGICKEWEEL